MANTITATIPFDYQGQHFEPKVQFDLDAWVKNSNGEIPDFTSAVAGASGFGGRSHEVEAMEAADVQFSDPNGMADRFYNFETKEFDFTGFRKTWLKNVYFSQLNQISQRHLGEALTEDSPQYLLMLEVLQMGKKG
ncbi:MAG: hypothetical protein PF440_06665 [Thiomicrorhabdus sp.]|jgi:hypothetical protein|nr:hypothetical protein [Thiomicrorhabdus sp.]